MKKFFVMLAMLTMTLAANAQFEKGKMFIGASVTGLDLKYNGANKFSMGLNAQVGSFLSDDGLVYGLVGYERIGGETSYNLLKIGGGGRYYITQNGIFLGGQLCYVHGSGKYNDFKPQIEIGYAFFVGKEMTIEPALYYEHSFDNHSQFSTVGLKLGIGLYLKKDKIKNSVKEALQ